MSSGFGFNSGTGRCFGTWQRFMECYSSADTENPQFCRPIADDYFECLHHTKERARVSTIREQQLKNQAEDGKSHSSTLSSVAVSKDSVPEALGLITN